MNEYLAAGTKMVWVVYPDEKRLYVFRLDADGSLRGVPHDVNAVLDGAEVLPGFSLPVKDIFPHR